MHKLRIGYLSFDFRNHPMGYLTLGLLRDTNRSLFVVTAYQYGVNDKSKQRERLVAAADTFRDVRTSTDFHAAAVMAEPRVALDVRQIGISQALARKQGNTGILLATIKVWNEPLPHFFFCKLLLSCVFWIPFLSLWTRF